MRKAFVTKKNVIIFMTLILCLILSACGGSSDSSAASGSGGAEGDFEAEYHEAEYHEDSAEGSGDVQVDLSCVNDGYFGVIAESDTKLKVQVFKDDDTFTYDLVSGEPQIFPLQSGDGTYTIKVMENVSGNSYYEKYSTSASVSLSDEFAPFVRPNAYADYSEDSDCVKEASKLAEGCSTESEFVGKVYDYICKKVDYDYKEAETVESGYVPDPDEVLDTGKGICFDYASLAASMLRSHGIPTKIIFGYVAPDNLYHAWNMFYTEEKGWTTVEFSVDPGDWTRVDLTFSANGQNADFIGDGTNYQDVYEF